MFMARRLHWRYRRPRTMQATEAQLYHSSVFLQLNNATGNVYAVVNHGSGKCVAAFGKKMPVELPFSSRLREALNPCLTVEVFGIV